MENNKTRVSVFVAGQRFNILTDKSEKYVLDIASKIDSRINSLVLSSDMTRERAAVLTALLPLRLRSLSKMRLQLTTLRSLT
jgi:cell division protein ZapA (FtsZ GTPase activity inhibitor)